MQSWLRKGTAVILFAVTIAAIAVMFIPDLWARLPAELGVFGLAIAWLLIYASGNSVKIQLNKILIPLAGAACWPLLQLAAHTTIYSWNTLLLLMYWAVGAAVTFLGLQLFSDVGLRRSYLRALIVAGFIIAVIGPVQMYTSDTKVYWVFATKYASSPIGPFVYTNQYAAFIELLLPIALTEIFSEHTGWRTFHGLAVLVMYASVLASASRTGFVLTTFEVVLVPLLTARRLGISYRRLLAPAVGFLALLIVIGVAAGPERLIAKLEQKNPYSGRREFLESSMRMIPERPLLGVGLGNWGLAYPAYATFDDGLSAGQAHNDWVQWTVEGGIPFVLLLLSVAAWSVRQGYRTGWGFGVAFVFVQCFVDYPIAPMALALVFFTLLAAIAYPDERWSGEPRRQTRRCQRHI